MNKKKSRAITVGDNDYRWSFFENSGWNDLTIQNETGNGRKLVVQLAWGTAPGAALPYPAITPAIVADAIEFGLANGWNPDESGRVFVCTGNDGKFSVFSKSH